MSDRSEQIEDLEQNLMFLDENTPDWIRHKQQIWLLNGVNHEGYDMKTLEVILLKYEKLNLVPSGYNHPELYFRELNLSGQGKSDLSFKKSSYSVGRQ